ncbi:MAG: homocysteine S-methyltransferase family protein, partial [Bacteroidales bacterium]|nr:homocysteine S-methyltransferase family protein [Bacteroidales bacterium]
MDRQQQLEAILQRRIMVLDGAMGTVIQQHGLAEDDFRGELLAQHPVPQKGNNDVLTLTRPQLIASIHRQYLEAGADIIETNTFSSTTIAQREYGTEALVEQLNRAAAQLARQQADDFTRQNPAKPRFVAGSMGPTGVTLSMSPDVANPALRTLSFDQFVEAYAQQAAALIEGGVDVLLIETIFDTLNAKAALFAIANVQRRLRTNVPVMLSATVADTSGRLLAGQTIEAFVASVEHYPLLSVGLNCSFGPEQIMPYVDELSRCTDAYVSVHPNAGLPNQLGLYDQTPELMASAVGRMLTAGMVNIVGGCCGTTPDHIARIAQVAALCEPRRRPQLDWHMRLSGLEPLEVSPDKNFINVGERTNVAGSKKFARLIAAGQYAEAVQVAREQVDGGAQAIDVCMDDAMIDAPAAMTHFLNLIASEPEIARVPIMIDSSRFEVIEAGLKCAQGKCVVNSISLKEGEEEFIRRASIIRQHGAAVVVMLFDEQGQATTTERRIEVARRSYEILTQRVGFRPTDIVFDPNILAIGTGMAEHDSQA